MLAVEPGSGGALGGGVGDQGVEVCATLVSRERAAERGRPFTAWGNELRGYRQACYWSRLAVIAVVMPPMLHRRIFALRVTGLQDSFDYIVRFPAGFDSVILIAPNGYGKTALLSLTHACVQLKLVEAARHSFKTFEVEFEDGMRWHFEKTARKASQDERLDDRYPPRYPSGRRRGPHRRDWVAFSIFDADGVKREPLAGQDLERVPHEILMRALDRSLPISRMTYDTFRDMRQNDTLKLPDIIERYRDVLLHDPDFRSELAPFEAALIGSDRNRRTSVFIETQRLANTFKSSNDEERESAPAEEISRQSQYLASLLQKTFANYASTSQGLDRSFPSRLISRAAAGTGSPDPQGLRADLDAIEHRRKLLTEAGILVESAEPLVAPKDEFLGNVADALSIYVDDSRAKLSTFDDIYGRVSVFRSLLNKKLRPKDVNISREEGAIIRRGDKRIDLTGLSSGEKHEFIMLFRLIFETPGDSLVLIDEPEISLHVLWQLEFMSDLRSIQAANPFQSIIATHSPQIFQGVDNLIVDLAEQVQ